MVTSWRPRVGLVSVRFRFFDEQMPPEFPARMQERARRYAAVLGQWCDVVYPGLIEDEGSAGAAARALAAERLDAIVFAPTMAAPPSFGAAVLRACPVPVVIWNPGETRHLPAGWTQAQATEYTAAVACVMLANVLIRDGRPVPVVTAPPDDAAGIERLRRTVCAAAAAGSFRDAVALRIGDPIAGYLDVEASAGDLASWGYGSAACPPASSTKRLARPRRPPRARCSNVSGSAAGRGTAVHRRREARASRSRLSR